MEDLWPGKTSRTGERTRLMLCRRLAVWLPLAGLVAVLAHGLCFGAQHLPGTTQAGAVLGTLAAGLALVAVLYLLAGAVGLPVIGGASLRGFPAIDERFLSPAALSVAGGATFGLIELAEGHAPFAGGWTTLAALLAATAIVWCAGLLAARLLRVSGRALAALSEGERTCATPAAPTRTRSRIAAAWAQLACSARGRAPPHLATATL